MKIPVEVIDQTIRNKARYAKVIDHLKKCRYEGIDEYGNAMKARDALDDVFVLTGGAKVTMRDIAKVLEVI